MREFRLGGEGGKRRGILYFLIVVYLYFSLSLKVAGKREPSQELEAQQWIEAVTGERFPPDFRYEDVLRDGIVLCKLINRLAPGIIQKINTTGGDYKMMDNINQ